MSKIVAMMDTESKTLDVTIDGTSVENAREIFCMGGEYYHARITAVEDEKEDIVKVTTYMSRGSAEAKKAIKQGKAKDCDYKDFVAISKFDSLEEDIAEYLR